MAQPMFSVTYDDSGLSEAFRMYFDLKKNIDIKKEVRRRAGNVALRLVGIYKKNAPSKGDITTKVDSLGYRVKVRPKIRKLAGKTQWKKIQLELAARQRARTFTCTGWFPAAEKLGKSPRKNRGVTGPIRGRHQEKASLLSVTETLINDQPGAAHMMDRSGNALQMALDKERDDMLKYIMRKQDEAARKAGL
jgi:hypothetical protein